jgi:serine O-acetyltransferase
MNMNYRELKYNIYTDLYRYYACTSFSRLVKEVFWGIGFRFSFWLRICSYFHGKWGLFPFYLFCRLLHRKYMFKFGISIPCQTSLGEGLYIGHFGDITINGGAKIGKNLTIMQGVTIGQANRGERKGNPTIGNNVFIGPGAKIIGKINVGNNVVIGPNCVVIHDIPDNSVVVGIPGKVISSDGAEGYVCNVDYKPWETWKKGDEDRLHCHEK